MTNQSMSDKKVWKKCHHPMGRSEKNVTTQWDGVKKMSPPNGKEWQKCHHPMGRSDRNVTTQWEGLKEMSPPNGKEWQKCHHPMGRSERNKILSDDGRGVERDMATYYWIEWEKLSTIWREWTVVLSLPLVMLLSRDLQLFALPIPCHSPAYMLHITSNSI